MVELFHAVLIKMVIIDLVILCKASIKVLCRIRNINSFCNKYLLTENKLKFVEIALKVCSRKRGENVGKFQVWMFQVLKF
jgi:hypothetical protein